MKNEQKTVVFDKKLALFNVATGVGVAIIMVYIFGKLAPMAIISYRLVSQILRPLFV